VPDAAFLAVRSMHLFHDGCVVSIAWSAFFETATVAWNGVWCLNLMYQLRFPTIAPPTHVLCRYHLYGWGMPTIMVREFLLLLLLLSLLPPPLCSSAGRSWNSCMQPWNGWRQVVLQLAASKYGQVASGSYSYCSLLPDSGVNPVVMLSYSFVMLQVCCAGPQAQSTRLWRRERRQTGVAFEGPPLENYSHWGVAAGASGVYADCGGPRIGCLLLAPASGGTAGGATLALAPYGVCVCLCSDLGIGGEAELPPARRRGESWAPERLAILASRDLPFSWCRPTWCGENACPPLATRPWRCCGRLRPSL
jgi:hypothetical protein